MQAHREVLECSCSRHMLERQGNVLGHGRVQCADRLHHVVPSGLALEAASSSPQAEDWSNPRPHDGILVSNSYL